MLHINPAKCLMDEKVHIKITNLEPCENVTVRCTVEQNGFVYDSLAHFIASSNGEVDLANDPSFGGSYIGIDQMGIFWSMLPATGQKLGLRYIPRNVTDPAKYKLQAYKGHLKDNDFVKENNIQLDKRNKKQPIVEGVVLRCCSAPGVTRHEVKHGSVRGTIFKPPGKGPFKGVIDVYGSAGGIVESRAALLASHGFIAFTLPHHRYRDLPKELHDVSIEYFIEAIDYFSSLDAVQPGIGMIGISSGGLFAMVVSALSTKLSGIISINSLSYISFVMKKNGQQYPPIEDILIDLQKAMPWQEDDKGGILVDLSIYDERTDHLTLNIDHSNAKFLLIAGEDDKCVNNKLATDKLMKKMYNSGKGGSIDLLLYPGAGHFIDPPYMPLTLLHYNPIYKRPVAVGGEIVQTAAACIHSWTEILKFLNANVGKSNFHSML